MVQIDRVITAEVRKGNIYISAPVAKLAGITDGDIVTFEILKVQKVGEN